MGGGGVDLFLTDPIATPPELRGAFSERLVYLSPSYYLNDHARYHELEARNVNAREEARRDAGLPQSAFIFGNMNQPYKYDSSTVRLWLQTLDRCPDSVLLLIK
jgi:predicted O-linked N-acetylglucosamine transferase (SPINDLY family)